MNPEITIPISEMNIKAGETLTVVVQDRNREPIIVEIRCLKDGTPELFCDKLEALPFKEWRRMQ